MAAPSLEISPRCSAGASDETSEIEANGELVETLRQAAGRGEDRWPPTAIVLPIDSCLDEHRWFDRIEWHEIRAETRACLSAPPDADFRTLLRAAYARFSHCAAAGVAFHF